MLQTAPSRHTTRPTASRALVLRAVACEQSLRAQQSSPGPLCSLRQVTPHASSIQSRRTPSTIPTRGASFTSRTPWPGTASSKRSQSSPPTTMSHTKSTTSARSPSPSHDHSLNLIDTLRALFASPCSGRQLPPPPSHMLPRSWHKSSTRITSMSTLHMPCRLVRAANRRAH